MRRWGIVALGLLAIAIVAFWWSSPIVEDARPAATNTPPASGVVEQPQPALERDGSAPEVAAVVEHIALPIEAAMAMSTPRISGRVVLENGAPPPRGTRVRALWGSAMTSSLRNGVETKPDGSFTLEADARFRGRLFAHADGYAISQSREFAMGNRHVEDVRIVLRKGGTVGGVVLAPGGFPVAGARVSLLADSDRPMMHQLRPTGLEAESDYNGVWLIEGAPKGFIALDAWGPGYSPAKRVELRLEDEPRYGIQITLSPNIEVKGRVVDQSGRPIAGASVSQLYGQTPGTQPVETDEAGRFTLSGLPESARYRLQAQHDDYLAAWALAVSAREETVIDMVPRPPPISYIGKLIDKDTGEPILNARFRLGEDGAWRDATDGLILLEEVASDGTVQFQHQMGRNLTIEAKRYDWCTWTAGVRWDAGPVVEEEIVLEKSARLIGRLIDEETGQPLSGIKVQYAQSAVTQQVLPDILETITDRDGRFDFEEVATARRHRNRVAGHWGGNFSGPGLSLHISPGAPYADLSHPFPESDPPKPGSTLDFGDLLIGKGRTIEFKAIDTTGIPSPGHVFLLSSSLGFSEPVKTDMNGIARFDRVGKQPAGMLELADHGIRFHFSDSLEPEQSVIVPVGTATLEVEVLRANRPSPAHVELVFTTSMESDGATLAVRQDLRPQGNVAPPYRFELLPAGEWTVRVRAGYQQPVIHEETVRLRSGENRVHQVDADIARISGTVVTSDGGRLPGRATVALYPIGETSRRVPIVSLQAEGNGQFVMDGVRSGSYILQAHLSEVGIARLHPFEVFPGVDQHGVVLTLGDESGSIRVVARDADSGEAIVRPTITFRDRESRIDIQRTASGTATGEGHVLAGLPPGEGYVWVWAEHHDTAGAPTVVRAGEVTLVEIELDVTGHLRWAVQAPQPQRPAVVELSIYRINDGEPALIVQESMRTGGRFPRKLRPGKYMGILTSEGHRDVTVEFVITARETTTLTTRLEHDEEN